jgi:hypothetical protein
VADPDDIVNACKQLRIDPANARECNQFVISVAARFGVTIGGTADEIMEKIAGVDWTQHGNTEKLRRRRRYTARWSSAG